MIWIRIATLVRRAFAEVCTVPVLLVLFVLIVFAVPLDPRRDVLALGFYVYIVLLHHIFWYIGEYVLLLC